MEEKKQRQERVVLSDDLLTSDESPVGGWTARSDDWVEPTMEERLARDFNSDADCYLVDGRPCVVWTDLDLAYDYSVAPPKEIHPFMVIGGEKIDFETFKTQVRRIHGL